MEAQGEGGGGAKGGDVRWMEVHGGGQALGGLQRGWRCSSGRGRGELDAVAGGRARVMRAAV